MASRKRVESRNLKKGYTTLKSSSKKKKTKTSKKTKANKKRTAKYSEIKSNTGPDINTKETYAKNYRHEYIGLLIFCAGILMILAMYFGNITGIFGEIVFQLGTGLLGIVFYVFPIEVFVYGALIIFKKDRRRVNRKAVYFILFLFFSAAILHSGYFNADRYINGMNFFSYIKRCYLDGNNLIGGGVLGGLLALPVISVFQKIGAVIIFATLSIIMALIITDISVAGIINTAIAYLSRDKMASPRDDGNKGVFLKEFEDEKFKEDILRKDKVIDFKLEIESRAKPPYKNKKFSGEDRGKKNDDEFFNIKVAKNSKKINYELSKTVPIKVEGSPEHIVQYSFPSFDLLNEGSENGNNYRQLKMDALEKAKKLEYTLENFGIKADVVNITVGPAITRYELQPGPGVKVSKIVNLADDIALNLAASAVRIEAPIPGKAVVGVEVPNEKISLIRLREVLETPKFVKFPSKLAVALGKDVSGEDVIIDIARMPHLLIAGATGSGKSVCINSLIISILYKATPEEVKLLMIDPKVVELGVYNGIPHLLIPVVTNPAKAAGALNWAVQEMTRRYKKFADKGVRDITSYNKFVEKTGEEMKMPRIVIIIDELSDLMMVAPNDVEDSICRLAQMARAAGMYLVIATQRPSVNVITGVIKANIPSRISFAVSSQVDSRTILDMAGAEKLLGRGDMLYYPTGVLKPIRVKGAFVTDTEVERVVKYIKDQTSSKYNEDVIEEINNSGVEKKEPANDCDELLPKAIDLVIETGQASVSFIQRRFKVGYARAGRIIDQMAERGIISGYEGSKPRKVLITRQQWEEIKLNETQNTSQ